MATRTQAVITGSGLVCSVGHDVVTACASIRAGLARPVPLALHAVDDDTHLEEALTGHPVVGLSDGFEGAAAAIALTAVALRDCVAQAIGQASNRFDEIHVLVADDFYQVAALARSLAEFSEKALRSPMESEHASMRRHRRMQYEGRLLRETLRHAKVDIPLERQHLHFGGPAHFAKLLQVVTERARKERGYRGLVGAVGTQTEATHLAALYHLGLLRTQDRPIGNFPGDAAGFLVIEGQAQKEVYGVIRGIGFEQGTTHRFSGTPPNGRLLANAWEAAYGTENRSTAAFVNLTGDEYRARDYGAAVAAIHGRGIVPPDNVHAPAESVGDVGVAFGPVGISAALHDLKHGHLDTDDTLVLMASDDEYRGAIVVSRAP